MKNQKISVLVLSLLSAFVAWSDTSITDSRTPPEIAVGAPAGVYAINNLETYNPYNGSLLIHVPLSAIGGRGDAGYDLEVVIQQNWQIVTHTDNNGTPFLWVQGKPSILTGSKWVPNFPAYSPGIVVSRQTTDPTQGSFACTGGSASTGYSYYFGNLLTRLTFIDTYGTEHELVDTLTNGQPLPTSPSPPAKLRGQSADRRN